MDLVGLVLGSSTQRRVNHPACARVLAKWPCTWGLEVSSGHLPDTSAGFRALRPSARSGVGGDRVDGGHRLNSMFCSLIAFCCIIATFKNLTYMELWFSARVGTGLLGGTTVQILNDQSS